MVVIFALALIPVMGLTGVAFDYSRAQHVHTSMQAAADTTALMIAQGAVSQTATVMQTTTEHYFKAVFPEAAVQNLQVTGTYSNTNGPAVVVSATATYKTSFMGIMGFADLPLAASSTVSFGDARRNSGSMGVSATTDTLASATNSPAPPDRSGSAREWHCMAVGPSRYDGRGRRFEQHKCYSVLVGLQEHRNDLQPARPNLSRLRSVQ